MKVGILTHPLMHNYGGILQNWALQHVLKEMGHKPVTLRWSYDKKPWLHFLGDTLYVVRRRLMGKKQGFPMSPLAKVAPYKGLRKFVKTHIVSSNRINFFDLPRSIRRRHLDAVIVGSDQVWRALYFKHIEYMFLPFEKGNGQKKISYAASFGVDEWEFTPEQTTACGGLLRDFDAVSVREFSGVELCRKYFGRDDVQLVLDPTLLVDRENYDKLCSSIPVDKKGYVFAYILDSNDYLMDIARRKAAELELPVKTLSVDKNVSPADTVELWLAAFRDARYVVTDSFHGTVFSLIFHMPFAVFCNQERGNARFDNLFHLFPSISGRIIRNGALPAGVPDWSAVDACREQFRKKSLDFLVKSLN